jgi:hypothetical protein
MDDKPTSTEESQEPAAGTIFTPYRRTQFFVLVACVICFLLFWWAGRVLRIPADRGFEASLLQQPHWPLDLLAVYVLFGVSLLIGTLIAGWTWFFAGVFSATIGLIAFSARGGPMHYVLFHAAANGSAQRAYLLLMLEQVLLFIPIAIAWWAVHRRYDAMLPVPEHTETAADDAKQAPAPNTLMALVTQLVAMGFLVLLFAPTDAKKQVLIGVFIAGIVGSALAEYLFPDRKAGGLYWVGPFLVGFIGYLLAHWAGADFTVGAPQGNFAALARPLPLDYASAGAAGALLGYWIGAERPPLVKRSSTESKAT